MLCPDVWSFPVVKNDVSFRSGNFDKKSQDKLKNIIENHPFNNIISIILPEENSIPQKLIDLFQDSDHYTVKNFDFQLILRREFIEGFVKRGKFSALSSVINNELDDCIAITPNGLLILSISKHLYQTLGLEGLPPKFLKNKEKYIVRVNLLNPDLRVCTKYYERVKNALAKDAFKGHNLMVTWTPPSQSSNEIICPSSVAKYFHDNGCCVELTQTKVKIQKELSVRFPKICHSNDDEFFQSLLEAIGMLLLSCDMNPDENLSSYQSNTDFEDYRQVLVLHCKGFFSNDFIKNVLNEISSIVESNLSPDWFVLHVHGYPYAPVDFFGKEHAFRLNGDNDYSIVLYSTDKKYFFCKNVSTNKKAK